MRLLLVVTLCLGLCGQGRELERSWLSAQETLEAANSQVGTAESELEAAEREYAIEAGYEWEAAEDLLYAERMWSLHKDNCSRCPENLCGTGMSASNDVSRCQATLDIATANKEKMDRQRQTAGEALGIAQTIRGYWVGIESEKFWDFTIHEIECTSCDP